MQEKECLINLTTKKILKAKVISKIKRQITSWGKILEIFIADKEFLSQVQCKELLKVEERNTENRAFKWAENKNRSQKIHNHGP